MNSGLEDLEKTFGISFGCKPQQNTVIKMPRIALNENYVRAIYVDEIEKVVTVVFFNGDKEVVRCSKDDEFDIAVGAAIGICRGLFGKPNRFYEHVVRRKTHYTKKAGESDYATYCKWCKKNGKRTVTETTFKKNKNKYLAKMKGENK